MIGTYVILAVGIIVAAFVILYIIDLFRKQPVIGLLIAGIILALALLKAFGKF